MNLKRTIAATAAGALAATGIMLGIAMPADAHTPQYGSTCSAFEFDLSRYSASVPGKDAVDPTFHDWDETIPGTPAIPAVPDKTVPDGFEKFTWTNPHTKPSVAPPSAGWNDVGKTSDTKGSTPDTILHQGQGNGSYFYFLTLTKVIPGTPEVPGTPDQVIHHHDPLTPGSPAVPAKTNHYTLTVDGAVVLDSDFSTSASGSYTYDDQYAPHTWKFVVTSWDGIGNVNDSGTTTPCVKPLTPVDGTPSVSATGPTCERPWNTISYDIPEGLSIAGYTGSGSVRAEDLNLGYGEKSWPVDVAAGYSYDGPDSVSVTLVEPPTKNDCAGPQPEDKVVTTEWVDGKYGCDDTTVDQTREVTTTPYVLVDGEWVLDTENATTVTEHQSRPLTAAEIRQLDCGVIVPPVIITPPATAAPAPSPLALAPAPISQVSDDEALAQTGSDETGALVTILAAGIAVICGVALLAVRAFRRARQQ